MNNHKVMNNEGTGSPLFLVTFGFFLMSKISFNMQDLATLATIMSGFVATFVMLYKFFKQDKK